MCSIVIQITDVPTVKEQYYTTNNALLYSRRHWNLSSKILYKSRRYRGIQIEKYKLFHWVPFTSYNTIPTAAIITTAADVVWMSVIFSILVKYTANIDRFALNDFENRLIWNLLCNL